MATAPGGALMPPVRAVLPLVNGGNQPDGAQIVCQNRAAITLNTAAIPVAQRVSATATETALNTSLVTSTGGEFQAVVHVFSVIPLVLAVWCGDNGIPVPANWWAGDQ